MGTKRSADVLIVGGGPAGLAAAIALRQRGADVTVADAQGPSIDKVCGEGLLPDSLEVLAQLGVEVSAGEGAGFRGIRFVNHGDGRDLLDGDTATAQFPALDGSASEVETPAMGMGMRREALHARMVQRAAELGVVLRWRSPVQLLEGGRVLVAGAAARFGWLVGADGQSSMVRRWAGLERGSAINRIFESRRFGFRRHFRVEPWSPYVEVHWGRCGQAYVTPTGPNEVCVAGVVRDPKYRLDSVLDSMPALRRRLAGKTEDRERGAITTTRRLARVATEAAAAGRVTLVGDASGSVDAITGEGMGMAFRQAPLLADCVEMGDLERYNRLHPAIMQLPRMMAGLLLVMDRHSGFRERAVRLLAREPELFARLVGIHLGVEAMGPFVAAKGLEMAWGMLAPGARESGRVAQCQVDRW